MIDKDIKIKSLEFELESRQTQVLQLETKVATLETRINQNADVLELQEKIKMLESQNLKLIEKNQSDVVEWKTKEREFKQLLKLHQDDLATVKAELELANQQLSNQQHKDGSTSGMEQTIRDLQLDCNDLKSINEKLVYTEHLLNLEKEKLTNQIKDLEVVQKQMQDSQEDQRAQHNKELQTLREQLLSYQSQIFEREKMHEEQLRNLTILEQQMEGKAQSNKEEIEQANRKKDILQCENDSLKKVNEKQLQEMQYLNQQLNCYSEQVSEKEKQLQELQNQINAENAKFIHMQSSNSVLQAQLKDVGLTYEKRLQDKDAQIQNAKRDYENRISQLEIENATILEQLQLVNDQNRELLMKQRELQIIQKESTSKQLEKDKKLIEQFDKMRKLDQEVKALMKLSKSQREQIIILEGDLSKAKEQVRMLQRDKSELKQQLDFLIAQQNKKGKLSEIELLKKQVQEQQTELVLLKQSHKAAQSSLKSTMESAGYFKEKSKRLDFENQTLLDSKTRLESLFQELLETTKAKKMQRNYSEVQIKGYQGKLITENNSTYLEPMTERQTAKTSTNQAQKNGDVRSLFKRPIQVVKIRQSSKKRNQENQSKNGEEQQTIRDTKVENDVAEGEQQVNQGRNKQDDDEQKENSQVLDNEVL
ncbi:unnamed protein product (macronuclear) [Paramecium tetraurelia]|uniref:Uncharacterized protein n=1 Tax=Paramecium tetraurelia TaxID=5888 RepID=A0C1Y4_PARTE|nr:uncharacterized protein GSPATT00034278001 [Paramecium tetraurelia]CAK64801.1 unnamed protein product [Paramecium tetraurelia]|eukprot:XP_001432198.1 hypothetical protein (macronuclear) [Paramecium tetraurelia strain d4-2]